MIYLNPEVMSGLGEDTFWTWFKREFPSSMIGIPKRLQENDILLQYSTLGFPMIPGKTIALLWELLPEMKQLFQTDMWDHKIDKTNECAKYCTYRTISSPMITSFYEKFGTCDVLPIGVNTDLFKPLDKKMELRKKYDIPLDAEVGFWGGTTHPMKGYSNLLSYAKDHPDIFWIIVWKWKFESGFFEKGANYVQVDQITLNELMNCADFFLCCGLLRSYYMIEWEAMASNLPFKHYNPDIDRDFLPSNTPRDDVFRFKWDRISAKSIWSNYLKNKGVLW